METQINLRDGDAVFKYLRDEFLSVVPAIEEGAHIAGEYERTAFEILSSSLNATISYMLAVDGEVTDAEVDAIAAVSKVLRHLTDGEETERAVHKIMLKRISQGEFADLREAAIRPECVMLAAMYDMTYGTQVSMQVARLYYNFLISAANIDGKISSSEKKLLSEVKTYLFDELPSTINSSRAESDVQFAGNDGRTIKESHSLQNPQEELQSLIGLQSVKEILSSLVNKVKINQVRIEKGLPSINPSLHMVFTGNPGTGKTSVARLLGAIFRQLGVLQSGHLVEVDRSSLVAGYVGQTAIKTSEVIGKALGGVLFIDEAYSLSSGSDSYGDEAINTLLKAMEDNRGNLVVIVAGYNDEMETFINSNPGLRSRFDHFVHFPDYTRLELEAIFMKICQDMNMKLSNDGATYLRNVLGEVSYSTKLNSGNARIMRKLFQAAASNQADRLAEMPTFTDEDLQTFSTEDIAIAFQKALSAHSSKG
jgi:stage V sporulation protein K